VKPVGWKRIELAKLLVFSRKPWASGSLDANHSRLAVGPMVEVHLRAIAPRLVEERLDVLIEASLWVVPVCNYNCFYCS
jgi:hypothetical protein